MTNDLVRITASGWIETISAIDILDLSAFKFL